MENKKLILDIADVCLEINAKTDYAAFLSIYGHVGKIHVDVTVSKIHNQQRMLNEYVGFNDTSKLQTLWWKLKYITVEKNHNTLIKRFKDNYHD